MAFKLRSGNSTTFKNMGTSPFKDMKTGKYKQSFESPAKQRLKKGGEAQDEDKIFNRKGEHVGDWVNGRKVMHVQKDPKDTSIKKKIKENPDKQPESYGKFHKKVMKDDGGDRWRNPYAVKSDAQKRVDAARRAHKAKKKSPTKHTDTINEGSNRDPKYAAAHNKRHAEGDTHGKIGSKDNKWLKKKSPTKQLKKDQLLQGVTTIKSPAKQTDTTYADGTKKSKREQGFAERYTTEKATYNTSAEDHAKQDPYWYKIDGKKVPKYVYIKYKNKPGNMEGGGKTTNNPDVYGKKASNFGRGPKTKK
jgi:hypothetical protein